MKTAIVTGGTRGIGRATVERLSKEGYFVYFTYKNNKLIADEIESILDTTKVKGCKIDLDSQIEVQEFVKNVQSKNNSIDLIVINAGITKDSLFATMSKNDWLDVNFRNHLDNFYLLQSVIKVMIYQKGGSVIFISSIASLGGFSGQSNYSSSKGAMNSFAKTLAKELGKHNIRVNVVSPGVIETEMIKKVNPMYIRDIIKSIPLGRIGKPTEIATVINFLASDEASFIHGGNFIVDGGLS